MLRNTNLNTVSKNIRRVGMELYICNQAREDCEGCYHSKLHRKIIATKKKFCDKDGQCSFHDINACCVSVLKSGERVEMQTTEATLKINGLVEYVPQIEKKEKQSKRTYMSPARYYFKGYYTHNSEIRLFHAMRRAIKHICKRTIVTLDSSPSLWEVYDYVFIADRDLAIRAQKILIKWQGLNKNIAYHTCSDLTCSRY